MSDGGRGPERELPSAMQQDPARLLPEHASPGSEGVTTPYPPHHPARAPRHSAKWLAGILGAVLVYAIGMAIHDRWQDREYHAALAARMTGGDPSRGPALLRSFGCAQCHTIPGVTGARGQVGPPLTGIANRVYIGGVLTNTPDNIVRWIVDPKAVDSLTAMPVVGVSEAQARDIAAYLYTLR
jgi:cytochrome c2